MRSAFRFIRRALSAIVILVLVYVGAIVGLGLAYAAATPVSTLMLGRWLTLRSVTRTPVPLDSVSPALPIAVIASEDNRFCRHRGVDWGALREVVESADEDGPSRGASTIPMQTAKNLFLWSGRSYVRKALELPIALWLDLVWSKRRMMENYLNIAEWGEGLFGAEAAARRYFGKGARDLTRREAALLATALPNPILRNPGRPSPRHRALANRLLARMEAADALSGCVTRRPPGANPG
jgi:monofunctional biosynthetic peptidoglycan transglycosylase